jgi:hypothetical protein
MSLSTWILSKLDYMGRKRIVMDRQNNEPYLERYYLFLKDRKRFPFNIFLHKFLQSDPGDPHDHPWPYFTLILKGGYYEYVPIFNNDGKMIAENVIWRGPGHFRFCSSKSYHRVSLKPGITPWTLFVPGPQIREWGFLVNNKWIHTDDYLNNKQSFH